MRERERSGGIIKSEAQFHSWLTSLFAGRQKPKLGRGGGVYRFIYLHRQGDKAVVLGDVSFKDV